MWLGASFVTLHKEVKLITARFKVVKLNQEIILIKSDQIMGLINLYQRIELNKFNQVFVIIKSIQDVQLWHIGKCSIMTYGVTLNHDTQLCLDIIFET